MVAKAKVLLIDDDPDYVETTRIVLEANDFEVISAADGTEGLAKMRSEKPDLVLLDVIMAHEAEGADVSREMRDDPELRAIPVIMITSIPGQSEAGFFPTDEYLHIDQFISKPIQPDQLIKLANRYTRQRGGG